MNPTHSYLKLFHLIIYYEIVGKLNNITTHFQVIKYYFIVLFLKMNLFIYCLILNLLIVI